MRQQHLIQVEETARKATSMARKSNIDGKKGAGRGGGDSDKEEGGGGGVDGSRMADPSMFQSLQAPPNKRGRPRKKGTNATSKWKGKTKSKAEK